MGIVDYTDGTTVYYIDGNNTGTTPHSVAYSRMKLTDSRIVGYIAPSWGDGAQLSAPTNLEAALSADYIKTGASVTISASADNAESYHLALFKSDGTPTGLDYNITPPQTEVFGTAGNYYFEVYAENSRGKTAAKKLYLTVAEPESVSPTAPPSPEQKLLTVTATSTKLALKKNVSYKEYAGRFVTGDLQKIWRTSYGCDSPVISWTPCDGARCYRIAVRDLDNDKLVYEVYQYYDTSFKIDKNFSVYGPVRIWIGAFSAADQINPIGQGSSVFYMEKPTVNCDTSDLDEYYLTGSEVPLHITANRLRLLIDISQHVTVLLHRRKANRLRLLIDI